MRLTVRHSGKLQVRTPLEYMTGEMPDISEYLDFGWYDRFWYKEDAGLGETKIGGFLVPSHQVGSLMSYWIQPASDIPLPRTTVKRIMYLETCTNANKSRFKVFEDAIQEQYHENYNEATFTGEIQAGSCGGDPA